MVETPFEDFNARTRNLHTGVWIFSRIVAIPDPQCSKGPVSEVISGPEQQPAIGPQNENTTMSNHKLKVASGEKQTSLHKHP